MNNKKNNISSKLMWSFLALFVISAITLAGVTYAYRGDPNVKGPNYDAAVHEQLEAAIEAGDYDTWLKIRQDNNLPMQGRMFQVINKDNFAKYTELHDANIAGDTTTANTIRAELGLGQGMRKASGQGKMMNSNTKYSYSPSLKGWTALQDLLN